MAKKVSWDTSTRLYAIWRGMRGRCYSAKRGTPSWRWYASKGIKVCKEWDDYGSFERWSLSHGYADDLTLDRIDSNGDYEPCNCRWVTWKEQENNRSNNRLVTYKGKTQTISMWANEIGMRPSTLHRRISQLGWPIEKAIETPIMVNKRRIRSVR